MEINRNTLNRNIYNSFVIDSELKVIATVFDKQYNKSITVCKFHSNVGNIIGEFTPD